MAAELRAIEVTGFVDETGHLSVEEPLTNVAPGRVRLLVLAPDRSTTVVASAAEPDEDEWLRAAASSPSFAFLRDEAEDVYSPTDGKPFDDQG